MPYYAETGCSHPLNRMTLLITLFNVDNFKVGQVTIVLVLTVSVDVPAFQSQQGEDPKGCISHNFFKQTSHVQS